MLSVTNIDLEELILFVDVNVRVSVGEEKMHTHTPVQSKNSKV